MAKQEYEICLSVYVTVEDKKTADEVAMRCKRVLNTCVNVIDEVTVDSVELEEKAVPDPESVAVAKANHKMAIEDGLV